MTPATTVLLQQLHERSQTEVIARARAQFHGSNEEFLTLADEYETLAPRLRGRFLETLGLSSEDFESSQGTPLSLAVSAETGRFLGNLVLSHKPARILELGSSCGVSTLYFAEALRTVSGLDGTFDLVFVDVWANTYLNLFKQIERLLRPGSIVLADNMYTAEDAVQPYKRYLDDHPRFSTTTLDFESGIEFTVVVS